MRAAAIIKAEWREPVQVLATFADEPWAIGFLSGGDGRDARWSFLARRPDRTLILSPDDPRDAFAALRGLIGDPLPALADGPPFQGGVAGLASYDLGERVEPIDWRDTGWPDLACARYPALLAFDHRARAVLALGRGNDTAAAHRGAGDALAWLDPTGPPTSAVWPAPPRRPATG